MGLEPIPVKYDRLWEYSHSGPGSSDADVWRENDPVGRSRTGRPHESTSVVMVDGGGGRLEASQGSAPDEHSSGWRYRIGVGLFVVSLVLPLIAFLVVPFLGFPDGINAIVYALSLAGGPDLLLVAAAAVMGKENLDRLLKRVGPRAKRLLRWDTVTRRRYTIGLWVLTVAFLLPVAVALFLDDSVVTSDNEPGWGYYVMVGSGVAFIAAFLSMGAPLWRRVQAIYAWDARITLPGAESEVDSST